MHAMGALLWVLGYGVAVACVGLVLAVQERRKHRASEQKVNEVFEALDVETAAGLSWNFVVGICHRSVGAREARAF